MVDEVWVSVPNFEGLYEISNKGRIRSLDRYVRAANGKRFQAGRIMKDFSMKSGHRSIKLYFDGKRESWIVSALVLTAFIGSRPEGDYHACHNDGDPSNNRLENLRWGTRSSNELDKVRHGTHYEVNRTHCPRNHPLALPNLVRVKIAKGIRDCLACNRAQGRLRSQKWKHLSFQEMSDRCYNEILQE